MLFQSTKMINQVLVSTGLAVLADGFGERDNTELVNFYRGKKS